MKEQDDFSSRKEHRRKKLKDRTSRRLCDTDDPLEKKTNKNNNIKKIKEEIQEEEWEDWDRYYNH
jgi:hypothetical protein